MTTVFDEFFQSADVNSMKLKAYKLLVQYKRLKQQKNPFSRLKFIKIKSQIVEILDEIDYQEGRLQYANRPISHQSASAHFRCKRTVDCVCPNCWKRIRALEFRM